MSLLKDLNKAFSKQEKSEDQFKGCFKSIDCFLNNEPPVLDLLFGGLLAGTISVFAGAPATSKSMLVTILSLMVASGGEEVQDFCGMEAKKARKIAYLTLEDPESILHSRVRSICNKYALDEQFIVDNLAFVDLSGQGFDLSNNQTYQFLKNIGNKVDLIILDTWSEAHSVAENDNDEQKKLIKRLNALLAEIKQSGSPAPAILVVHHLSKESAKSDIVSLNSLRGGSAFGGSVKFAVYCKHLSDKEIKDCGIDENEHMNYVKMGSMKSSYAPDLIPVYFKKDSEGILERVFLSKKSNKQKATVNEGLNLT